MAMPQCIGYVWHTTVIEVWDKRVVEALRDGCVWPLSQQTRTPEFSGDPERSTDWRQFWLYILIHEVDYSKNLLICKRVNLEQQSAHDATTIHFKHNLDKRCWRAPAGHVTCCHIQFPALCTVVHFVYW